MLTQYETVTSALLQAPSSPTPLIPAATLDTYINFARLQVAAAGACIRGYPTLTLTVAQRQYDFSSITSGLPTGTSAIYHIRQLWFQIPGTAGLVRVTPRSFEYFGLFALNNPVPASGQPKMWSQFGQGEEGSFFIDPLPDLPYSCMFDVLGVPEPLIDDTTPEAIPDIWTLAVPFYAAWYGFMSLQRQADADMMMKRYTEQMAMARNAANPNLLMENWSQQPDPMTTNRLGVQPARAGG